MKILTSSFLTCAVKSCRSSPASYPLHFRDAQLLRSEIDYNPLLLRNLLPRINLDALEVTAKELSLEAMMPGREVLEKMSEGPQQTEGQDDGGSEKEDADMTETPTQQPQQADSHSNEEETLKNYTPS